MTQERCLIRERQDIWHSAKVNAPTETDTTVVTGDQMNLYCGAKVKHGGMKLNLPRKNQDITLKLT